MPLFPFLPITKPSLLELFADCWNMVVVFVCLFIFRSVLLKAVVSAKTPIRYSEGLPGVSPCAAAVAAVVVGAAVTDLCSPPQRWATLSRGPLTDL